MEMLSDVVGRRLADSALTEMRGALTLGVFYGTSEIHFMA